MGIKDVFLVLNRVDSQKDPRDIWDAISQVEKGIKSIISGEVHVYPLSSLGTLIARLRASENTELIKEEEEFSEFLKRTDKVQLDSYLNDFNKFYQDLDEYLLRVDKFDRLMRAPLLFLDQKVQELKQIWINKRKKQESDFFYKRYVTYLNDLDKIEKEFSKKKEEIQNNLENTIEIGENNKLHKNITDTIEVFKDLTEEDWNLVSKNGFQLAFKHLLTTIEKENIEEINRELFQNKKYNSKLEDLNNVVKPYCDKYADNAKQLLNILLKDIQDKARKLHKQWNIQIKEYLDQKFPISLPPVEAGLLKIEKLKRPKFKMPKKSATKKVKSKMTSILTLNKTKRLEYLKNQTSEIIDYVYKENQSYFNNGINENIGNLRNNLLTQVEKECRDAINLFKEHYDEDEKAGKKVIEKIEEINSQVENIDNLHEQIKLAIEKLPNA